jgi:hypothetical protein
MRKDDMEDDEDGGEQAEEGAEMESDTPETLARTEVARLRSLSRPDPDGELYVNARVAGGWALNMMEKPQVAKFFSMAFFYCRTDRQALGAEDGVTLR